MRAIENHVVNFSGGRTSGYLVGLFEQRKKRENINVEYIYCDTGAEHPETYKFIKSLVDNWGIELTCIRTIITCEYGVGPQYRVVPLSECKQDLVPFMDVCRKHGTPTVAAPLCSDRMKGIPADKYCDDKYGRGGYTKWLGMRADEPSRIKETEKQLDMFKKAKPSKAKKKRIRYLGQIDDITKEEVIEWWAAQSFDLDLEEHLGNCCFCIKKGANKVALAAKDEPEMAKKFIEMVGSDEVASRPTRKDVPNNVMYRQNQSLESIIASYADVSREDLSNHVKFGKSLDSGSCSESCEAGVPDPDLFDI